MLGKLITGDVKLNNLSGPISIAKGGWDDSGTRGCLLPAVSCWQWRELKIINLFQLPVLDGGHLLFPYDRKPLIKGRTGIRAGSDFCYRIGSILLVLLMGLALFNDFSRL